MLSASLFIAVCSARNRIIVRLRRLREPRYLFGAALALVYFTFIFLTPRRSRRRGARGVNPFPQTPSFEALALPLGSAGLLLLTCAAWILPSRSRLFSFTDAEVAFLFPAPVSRRELLVHRLIRSQVGLVFAAIFPVLLLAPGTLTSASERVMAAAALWIMMATVRVYLAGVTMARDHLGASDPTARWTAWAPLLVAVGALAIVAAAIARELALPVVSASAALQQVSAAASTEWTRVVTWPLRALIQPFFASGFVQYLSALAGSILVLLTATVWVIKSDEIFQRVSRGEVVPAGLRAGRVPPSPKLRWADWSLPPTGRTETVFLWKNALETLRATSFKTLLPIVILIVYAVVGARFGFSTGLAGAICFAALMIAAFTTMIGPGNVMGDLRGDLRHLELLKTWPVKGSTVLRGEMLWPGLLITVCAWAALTCAAVLSGAAFPQVPFVWRLAVYGVAVIIVPALVFAQYAVHQAAAVFFPAWVPTDNRMRGFESMAQRLVLFAGIVLALVIMIVPGVVAAGIIAFPLFKLTGSPLIFVPAATVCLATVAVEIVVISEALGRIYDRIDLSAIERSE